MTHLAAWEESIYPYQPATTVGKFILQHPQELAIGIIHSRLAVAESFIRHRAHIQVFYTNEVVLFGYRSRFLMQKVPALIGCMPLYLGDTLLLFLIVPAPNGFMFQFTLGFRQFLL